MSTLFHPHVTCVWGDIHIGLGTRVRAFKLSCEAFQAVGECTNHLHHVHHSGITISTSWQLPSPISPVISKSSRPWSTCIIYCSQLLTIWSSMPLKSAVVTHIVRSRTSLWSWTRFGSGFRLAHRLLTGVFQHLLVIHIPLLLHLGLLSSRINFNFLFGFINFTSLVTLLNKLLPPEYPNPDLSEKCFWDEIPSSSFLVETLSILVFACTTSYSRNLTFVYASDSSPFSVSISHLPSL